MFRRRSIDFDRINSEALVNLDPICRRLLPTEGALAADGEVGPDHGLQIDPLSFESPARKKEAAFRVGDETAA